MPETLVSRLGRRNEFAEFRTVLNDAQNQVVTPVDVEAMARELVESGGREFVEMVRELSTALAQTRTELENANRRYEGLLANLERRGIPVREDALLQPAGETLSKTAADEKLPRESVSAEAGRAEWEEWDRKFQSLLA